MSDETLQLLTPEELVTITGQDEDLLRPSDDNDQQAWLATFLRLLAGEHTYTTAIEAAIEQKRVHHAFNLASSATERGLSLPKAIDASLHAAWQTWHSDFKSEIDDAKALLALVPEHEEMNELRDQYAAVLQEISAPSNLPGDSEGWRSCLESREQVAQLTGDLAALIDVTQEDTTQTLEQLRTQASQAWSVVLERLAQQQFLDGQPDAELLRALPDLVLQRQIEPLEQIARGEEPSLPSVRRSIPSQELRKARAALDNVGRNLSYIDINKLATLPQDSDESQVQRSWSPTLTKPEQKTPNDGQTLTTLNDVRKLNKRLSALVSYEQAATRWLSYAEKTTDGPIQALVQAWAFNCTGWDRIQRVRPRDATKNFEKVLNLVTTHWSVNDISDLLRHSLHGLVITKSWDRANSCAQLTNRNLTEVLAEWSNSLQSPVEWLAANGELDALSRVWAEIDNEEQATYLLDELKAYTPNAEPLMTECAETLLGARYLGRDPGRTIKRIALFVEGYNDTQEILETLLDIAEAVSRNRETRKPADQNAARHLITKLEKLLGESDLHESDLRDFSKALPEQLKLLIGGDTKYGAPNLRLRPLENVYYPDETRYGLLPILVINSSANAYASGYSLQVSCREQDGFEPAKFVTSASSESEDLTIPTLNAGSSHELVFRLELAPQLLARGVKSINFLLTIRSSSGTILELEADIEVRAGYHNRRDTHINPYVVGSILRADSGSFVGREQQLEQVRNSILGREDEKTPLVVGIRRIGKSSFVERLSAEEDVNFRFTCIKRDVSNLPDAANSVDFLMELASEIRDAAVESAKVDRKTKVETLQHQFNFHREEFKKNPFRAFEKFVDALDKRSETKRVLVILDEFDKMVAVAERTKKRQLETTTPLRADEAFLPEVIATLRSVMIRPNCRLRLILAGTPDLLKTQYDDRIFGSCLPVRLELFTPIEAKKVIDRASDSYGVLPVARDKLIRATGSQPYLLQISCYYLFSRMKTSGRVVATEFDVNEVLQSKLLPQSEYFTSYLDLAGGEEDRSVLQAVARAEKRLTERNATRQYVSTSEVSRQLQQIGQKFSIAMLEEKLHRLSSDRDRPLLKEDKRYGFRSTIGLLGDYILSENYL